MTKIIIDIFMYLFESVLFFYYANTLFKKKKSSKITFIIILFANSILCVLYQLNITYLNMITMLLLLIILFTYLYQISFKSAIFHSSIFIIVMLASEILTAAINSLVFSTSFNALENSLNSYIIVVVVSKIIYFSVMMIILKLFAKKEDKEQHYVYYIALFIMPLMSTLMLIEFRYITYRVELDKHMQILFLVTCIGILFANIIVFVIYENSQSNAKKLYELEAIKHQEEQDKQYFEIIDKSNKEMRIYAHDMKNHFIQLRSMENVEKIHNYIDKLNPELTKFSNIGISKNKMLDLIISKYVTLCEIKNIKLTVDLKTANLKYIDDVDLSTIMNNLLDNAVESAEQCKNPIISIRLFSKNKQYDDLIIRNSCELKPNVVNEKMITSKKDKNLHGIGTISIKKIVKKYNAIYDWKYDDHNNIFQTNIIFHKR